jgi:hypothetical protein
MPQSNTLLPEKSEDRKSIPITSGVLDYFPAALAEVAKVSKAGNDKHNPGQPLHHARGKSMDHADCIARHLLERGSVDRITGVRHSAELAWRALALLQEEMEAEGAPLARGARLPEPEEAAKPAGPTVCLAETPGGCRCTLLEGHDGMHFAEGCGEPGLYFVYDTRGERVRGGG